MFSSIKNRWNQFKERFSRIGSKLKSSIFSLLQKKDEASFEELEELFFTNDFGVQFSMELVDMIRGAYAKDPSVTNEKILELIKQEILSILQKPKLCEPSSSPMVILMVGVNGSGKTTTSAKLAHFYQDQGKKVLVGACDTFRAAATEQLVSWSEKLGFTLVKGNPKSDPAAVAFDAIAAAKARKHDVVIIDTAGRLHTKSSLMEELAKIRRVCQKHSPDYPHQTFLVLDATIGQNALEQAEVFQKSTPLDGIVLTKLDGSAKGGICVNMQKTRQLPVIFTGFGESPEDFALFDPSSFTQALFDE